MRSLKVIIFRDTDKPYTIILTSSLIVLVAFSTIALVSLLTFSVLGNIMLVGEAQAGNGEEPQMVAAGEQLSTDQGPDQSEDSTEEVESHAVEETPSETTEEAGGEIESAALLEDWAAPDSPFLTILMNGPAVTDGRIRYTVRVEKVPDQLGNASSGRFVAALITRDGRIGPKYPVGMESDSYEILNPGDALLFRISYRRDITVEFVGADLEDYDALALFVFEVNDPNRLLWRKIESIRE